MIPIIFKKSKDMKTKVQLVYQNDTKSPTKTHINKE